MKKDTSRKILSEITQDRIGMNLYEEAPCSYSPINWFWEFTYKRSKECDPTNLHHTKLQKIMEIPKKKKLKGRWYPW